MINGSTYIRVARWAGILSVVITVGALFVTTSSAFGAAKSAAFLTNNLRNGIPTAAAWDTECRNFLNSSGAGFENVRDSRFSSSPSLRDYMNNFSASNPYAVSPPGATYKHDTWISLRGSGNTTTPIDVNEGTTSIDFQVNALTFLCRSLVAPDLTAGCTQRSVRGLDIVAGRRWDGTILSNRWVTNTDPKEGAPNAVGGDCMFPAFTGQARYLIRVSIYENGVLRSTVPIGQTLLWKRDGASRYWFATPRYFTYTRSTGFTSDVNLRFELDYKKIDLVRDPIDLLYYTPSNTRVLKASGETVSSITTGSLSSEWPDVREIDDNYYLQVNVIPNPDFNLVPNASVTPDVISPADPSVNVTSTVENTLADTTPDDTMWGLARFVIPRNTAVPTNSGEIRLADNTGFTCQIANSVYAGITNCSRVIDGVPGQTFPGSTTTTVHGPTTNDVSSLGLSVGDHVCYATVVSHYDFDHDENDWRYSEPSCARVAKSPSVHILGNDVRVGSDFLATGGNDAARIAGRALQGSGGRYYGSWGEYGVLAPSDVSAFASAAGLSNGPTAPNQSSWSNLTFSNVTPTFGQFRTPANDLGPFPDILGYAADNRFQMDNVDATATDISVGNWGSPTQRSKLIYKPNNDVRITNNINRPNNFPGVDSMPQYIIIARNIDIQANVQNIDAWLIATGTIDTCSNGGHAYGGPCDNRPLRINGAVIADRLLLDRSFGADDAGSLEIAAEEINLPAGAYIWAYDQARRSGNLRTVSQRELPPRY